MRTDDLICHRADDYIFFEMNNSQNSIQINDAQLLHFCKFLEKAARSKKYIDLEGFPGMYIALEDQDEGTRNLCLISGKTYMVYNLPVKQLKNWAKFLRDNK
jgi:hypothetical protein